MYLSTEVCVPSCGEIPVDVDSQALTLASRTHSVLTPQSVIRPGVLCHGNGVREEEGIVGSE